MNNWVTYAIGALFLIFFVVAAYMLVSGWIRTAKQQVRLGRSMYDEFSADKQDWEKNRTSQENTDLKEAEGPNSPAESSGGHASGE